MVLEDEADFGVAKFRHRLRRKRERIASVSVTVPDDGGSSAPSTCSSELLPLPDGPVTTAASPGVSANVTSESTTRGPRGVE